MTARVLPSLRPMLPSDGPMLAEIFRSSIEELTGEDYSPAQQEVWMAAADDEDAFAARLGKDLTLVALQGRELMGFASLKNDSHIDMLYVRPNAAGQGVAKALCDALETLAAARGATAATVDASDTARDFCAHRGYTAMERKLVFLGDEALGNTTMKKPLAGKKALQ